MNGELYEQLRMLAREVQVGTSGTGFICPKCNGGRASEGSLSITRMEETRIAYCCHRASCGFNGYLGRAFSDSEWTESEPVSERNVASVQRTPQFQGRPFRGDVRSLGEQWASELRELYALDGEVASRLGWREEVDGGRLVVPIRGPLGQTRGVQLRCSKTNWRQYTGRKTFDYPELDETWMGWWRPMVDGRTTSCTVLVEDVLSAFKVSESGFIGVSLMGSHLSLDQLEEATGFSRRIVLALDRDATSKALGLASRWGFLANLPIMILERDLKYEPITKIREMVQSVITEV